MNLEWSLVLTIEEIGINKQDEVLDFEILSKKEEHDILLKELEYLRTLVNQNK